MPPLPAPTYLENRRLATLGLDAYPSSTFDVLEATAEDAWVRNPLPSAIRGLNRMDEELGEPTGTGAEFGIEGLGLQRGPEFSPIISADEANRKYGIKGHLKFDEDVPEANAKDLYDLKREELRRQSIMARREGGVLETSAMFGTGLAVTLVDPINIASAFIPVVSQARYAMWAARFGATGARLARGGVEGFVGAAAIEPLVYGVAQSEQADYTAVDTLLNLTFGTAIGGGLHAGLGKVGDLLSRSNLTEPALRGAVAALVEDRPVMVDATLRSELLRTTSLSGMSEFSTVFDAMLPADITVTREAQGLRAADEIRARFEQEKPALAQNVSDARVALSKAEKELNDLLTRQADVGARREEVVASEEARIKTQVDEAVAEKKAAKSRVQELRTKLKVVEAALRRAEERAAPIREAGVFNRGTKLDAKLVQYERQAADLRRQVDAVRQEIEAARTAEAQAEGRRVAADQQLRNFRSNQSRINPAAELDAPISKARDRLAEARSALQTAEAVLQARAAEAQAEAVMEARRLIAEASRSRITRLDRIGVEGVDRVVERAKVIKAGATTSDEIPVLEAEVAALERQLKQLEAGEAMLAQVDEVVQLAAARARAADAAANCQVLRGVRL